MQGPSNLQFNIGKPPHLTALLLNSHHGEGVPVVTSAEPWDTQWNEDILQHGAHQLAYQCLEFFQEEFVDMIKKHFWTVPPALLVLYHNELRLSPLGVAPQHEQ